MPVNLFFRGKNFFRRFWSSFPWESSFPRRIPGSEARYKRKRITTRWWAAFWVKSSLSKPLTSIPCKILEHIICHHIHLHLESNNILTHLNHRFCFGYSCESQLLTTTYDLLNSFDQKKQVDIAILDFLKALNTVPHRKLLHKLSHYGITGPLHQWLTTFLTHRTSSSCTTMTFQTASNLETVSLRMTVSSTERLIPSKIIERCNKTYDSWRNGRKWLGHEVQSYKMLHPQRKSQHQFLLLTQYWVTPS